MITDEDDFCMHEREVFFKILFASNDDSSWQQLKKKRYIFLLSSFSRHSFVKIDKRRRRRRRRVRDNVDNADVR